MTESFVLKNKLTILVNSCDAYEDLWNPFFTLLRKYWEDKSVRIVLNTESKFFSLEGITIDCISCIDKNYSTRIRNALSHIHTEYVLILLDDFFLRRPVDLDRIEQIIKWMDADEEIVYFNSDCTEVYADWEVDKYPGFRRIPPGAEYVLNLQAAIWRTKDLLSYWDRSVSPWEWEGIVSLRTINDKKKFYCTTSWENAICDYGYMSEGMGVFRGKWVLDDVKPLFEREEIDVDFTQRGIYDPEKALNRVDTQTRKSFYDCIIRCIGIQGLVCYFAHRITCICCKIIGMENMITSDFYQSIRERAKKKFLKQTGDLG